MHARETCARTVILSGLQSWKWQCEGTASWTTRNPGGLDGHSPRDNLRPSLTRLERTGSQCDGWLLRITENHSCRADSLFGGFHDITHPLPRIRFYHDFRTSNLDPRGPPLTSTPAPILGKKEQFSLRKLLEGDLTHLDDLHEDPAKSPRYDLSVYFMRTPLFIRGPSERPAHDTRIYHGGSNYSPVQSQYEGKG